MGIPPWQTVFNGNAVARKQARTEPNNNNNNNNNEIGIESPFLNSHLYVTDDRPPIFVAPCNTS